MSTAGATGVVVNMSGGLDSTVTAALAVEALGPERVYGLTLPCNKTGGPHARDAEALAGALGIDHDTVHLQPLFSRFGSLVPDRFDLHDEPVLTGNLVARLRMALAYLAANATGSLVLGTTNRSERLLGYLTKHGDGAADLLPIAHLYKTEVTALANALDVPRFVVEKRPTAGFLPGQYDREDLGAPYHVVDSVLWLATEHGLDATEIVRRLDGADGAFGRTDEALGGTNGAFGRTDEAIGGADETIGGADETIGETDVDRETVERLLDRHERSAHKRAPPPIPDRPPRRS